MRMRLTSYHAMSVTSPVNPSSTTIISATMTRVWPFCSRRNLAVRIHRHDGVVRHRELVEHRDEEPQGGPASVRVSDRDDGGVSRGDVVASARLPRLARGHEVELLAVHDRTAVELIVPGIDLTGGLRTRRGGLCDPDLRHVRKRDPGAIPHEDALHRRDHV